MRSYAVVILSIAASALAYNVTSPNAQQGWTSAGPNTITWDRVDTDASNFSVQLTNTNTAVMPQNNQVLAALVDGTSGSTTVNAPSGGFPVGGTFRVNLISTTGNGILAQSNEFNITQSTVTSSSSSGTVSLSSTSGSVLTVTPTGSSSSGAALNPSASDSSSTPTSSSNAALSSAGMHTGLLGLIAFVGALLA